MRKKNSLIDQLQNTKAYTVDDRSLIPINSTQQQLVDTHLYTNTITSKLMPKITPNEILPNSEGSYFVDSAIGSPLWSPLEGFDGNSINGIGAIPPFNSYIQNSTYSNTLPRTAKKVVFFKLILR